MNISETVRNGSREYTGSFGNAWPGRKLVYVNQGRIHLPIEYALEIKRIFGNDISIVSSQIEEPALSSQIVQICMPKPIYGEYIRKYAQYKRHEIVLSDFERKIGEMEIREWKLGKQRRIDVLLENADIVVISPCLDEKRGAFYILIHNNW